MPKLTNIKDNKKNLINNNKSKVKHTLNNLALKRNISSKSIWNLLKSIDKKY